MNLNTVEILCNFFQLYFMCLWALQKKMNYRWRLGQRWKCLYSPGANPWRAKASCRPHWFWRHGCHSGSWMRCTSSPIPIPPIGQSTVAISCPLFGCEFPRFLPCCEWAPPPIAGSSRSSRRSSVPVVLLLSSRRNRSPLRLCSQKVKCNFHRTKALPRGKKAPTPEIRKRFNVPTVLLSTGHSLCLLCYLTPSKEQFLGKKIIREFPISSASLLGFHFREQRNLKWL